MKKAINRETIIGKIYNHELVEKTVQNQESKNFGKPFISGTLDVATDDEGLNIVSIHYTYVTELTSKGNKNNTYTNLKKIIEGAKTILTDGADAATMVKCDTALALNDFYTNRNGEETLVQAKRNEGGFVSFINSLPDEKSRNKFEFDFLINGTRLVEADEERNIPKDYLIVKGAIFNFRNDMLPVELVCKNPGGIKYFESLDASQKNMTFTKVWGQIRNETVITKKVEESAFGEPEVKEYERTTREWVIEGCSKPDSVYEIGDEVTGITEDEIKQAIANRNVYLSEVKARQEAYQASVNKATQTAASSAATAKAEEGGFNF